MINKLLFAYLLLISIVMLGSAVFSSRSTPLGWLVIVMMFVITFGFYKLVIKKENK